MRQLFPGGDLVTGRIVRTLKYFGKTQGGKNKLFQKQNMTEKAALEGKIRWGWIKVARNQMNFTKAVSYLEAGRDQYYLPKALQCEHEVLSVLRLSWLTATHLKVCSLCVLAKFNLTLTKRFFWQQPVFVDSLRKFGCFFFLMSKTYFTGFRGMCVRSVHNPTNP